MSVGHLRRPGDAPLNPLFPRDQFKEKTEIMSGITVIATPSGVRRAL